MTISEKFQIIKKACDQLRVCDVHLRGEPSPREIQPIGICLTIKRGLIIVCLQVDGYSKKSILPKTCNFAMEDCEKIMMLEKKFGNQDGLLKEPNLCKDLDYSYMMISFSN